MKQLYELRVQVESKHLSDVIEVVNAYGKLIGSIDPVGAGGAVAVKPAPKRKRAGRITWAQQNDIIGLTDKKAKFKRPNSKLAAAYHRIRNHFGGAVFSRKEAEEWLRKSPMTTKESTNRVTHMLREGFLRKVKDGGK